MAGKGRKVKFHGAYVAKADAVRKERRTRGGYIQTIRVRGQRRYVVVSRR